MYSPSSYCSPYGFRRALTGENQTAPCPELSCSKYASLCLLQQSDSERPDKIKYRPMMDAQDTIRFMLSDFARRGQYDEIFEIFTGVESPQEKNAPDSVAEKPVAEKPVAEKNVAEKQQTHMTMFCKSTAKQPRCSASVDGTVDGTVTPRQGSASTDAAEHLCAQLCGTHAQFAGALQATVRYPARSGRHEQEAQGAGKRHNEHDDTGFIRRKHFSAGAGRRDVVTLQSSHVRAKSGPGRRP